MRKQGLIWILIAGTLAVVLFVVFKKEQIALVIKQRILANDTIIELSGYPSIKGMSFIIDNNSGGDALFYIGPKFINTLTDSGLVNSLQLDRLSNEQKCIALWKFIGEWTDHDHPAQLVEHNYYSPAMMINGIEGGLCDKRSAALVNLAGCDGTPGRVYKLKNHVVAELWYNNAWHMFDADKGIYYRRPDGEIADIAYLNSHPQLISAETKNLDGFMPKWRNEDTRRALSPLNYVDTTYKVFQKNYSAALRLLPGEKLDFELTPINPVKKFIRVHLGKRDKPCFVRKGTRTRDVKIDALKYGTGAQKIYDCKMPYPITHLKITSKNITAPVKVYYSPDSLHWYFEGIMAQANSCLDFEAFDKDNFSFTFNYWLKFEGDKVFEKDELTIETIFTFSEKMLLSNPERAFVIHPLNGAGKNISVTLSGYK